MIEHPINVLVVATQEEVTREVERLLQEIDGHGFYLQRVVGMERGLTSLKEGCCDVILLDVTPENSLEELEPIWESAQTIQSQVTKFLRIAESSEPPIPLLVLVDESVLGCGTEAENGGLDLLPRLRIDRNRASPYLLERAICCALERMRLVQELNEIRTVDPLTGLLSAKEIKRQLHQELERCRRYRYPVGVLALRVQGFGQLLEEFGDAVGDQILRWVGMILSENIRTVDHAARLNEAEFLVLLPETESSAALHVANRLRHRIASRPFVLFPDQGPVLEMSVNVSIGVVEGTRDGEVIDTLIQVAERALREAERQKKTNVVVFD